MINLSKTNQNMELDRLIRDRPGIPELQRDVIHVWGVHTSVTPGNLQALNSLLDPDESARAANFHFERDRRTFTVSRGCLRLLASAYSATKPGDIQFYYGPQGKPELSSMDSRHLRLNVSHSGEVALLAFGVDREIGVDVEFMRPELDFVSLAETSFSKAEQAAIVALPPDRCADLFYEYWSCKEACIKADGRGLSVPLGQFSIVPSQPPSGGRLP